jgi:hypothetical protein
MRLSAGVEGEHGRFDRSVDPGLRPVGTTEQHAGEITIGGNGEATRAEALGEAS